MTQTDQQIIEKLKERIAYLQKRKDSYKSRYNSLRQKYQSQGPKLYCHKNYRRGLDPETIARVWDALADEKSNNQIAKELNIAVISVKAVYQNESKHIAMQRRALEEMENLSFREREVLRLRFGFSDGRQYTLAGISEIFNVSRERIRQIEIRALNKLRRWMKRGDV